MICFLLHSHAGLPKNSKPLPNYQFKWYYSLPLTFDFFANCSCQTNTKILPLALPELDVNYRVAQKSKPPAIFQKTVLNIANEIRFLRKVKV